MSVMVRNDLLERAVKDPSILTPEEVSAVVAEVLRDRKFIRKMTTTLPVAKNQRFYRDLLAVSDGTWATLTGLRRYDELSQIRLEDPVPLRIIFDTSIDFSV